MRFYILAAIVFFILKLNAQEVKVPINNNVLLNNLNKTIPTNEPISLNKSGNLTIPFNEYFTNTKSTKPDALKWDDQFVKVNNLNAIFDSKNNNEVLYNNGFSQADVLTTKQFNTLNAGLNAFILINYSTGIDWILNDSLLLQVKGNNGAWSTLWKSTNKPENNKDVLLNIDFVNDLKSNILQFRFASYCNTDTIKSEVFKVHQLVVSYKNSLPFFESFRQFNPLTKLPLTNNWSGFTTSVSPNDSDFFKWGNTVIFNSLTEVKDSSYFNNNGIYGNADTLILNPIDFSKLNTSNQHVLSFWIRCFAQTKTNDSLYLEGLDNQGRWQRLWATNKFDTVYKKINVNLINGRFFHSFFMVRFINKGTYLNTNNLSFAVGAIKITEKINMPLFDDFSSTLGFYPNPNLWQDKKVFINNNFPVNQPSLNVATFDGLDENGNAYSTQPIKTVADILTSRGFNLATNTLADSIYLSFYYQYHLQGTTGQIQPTDSLYLEFRSTPNDRDSFDIVWQKSALDTLPYDTFTRVLIAIPKKYLHDDFQFRFKNIGSLSGNVSQWHIDYIEFDAGRNRNDTFNNDIAISSTPTSMLRKYRSMPWKHFELNKKEYTTDSVFYKIFNNDKRNFSVDYTRELRDENKSLVFKDAKVIGSVPFTGVTQLVSTNATNLNSSTTNLVKKFTNTVKVSNNGFANNDDVPSNDSIVTTTTFSNYFAYDDGSAEAGYGFKLKTNASLALAFDLEKVDTIYGVQIFFNQSEYNVSTRKFDFMVWDYITPIGQNATLDRVIYRKNNLSPTYTNTINGFSTIIFDSAIVVPKKFYVGWQQVGQFVLNVGLDENYYDKNQKVLNPNMFYKTDGFWLPTEIPGALMIRPLLGQIVDVPTSIINPKTKDLFTFNVFPNPAKRELNIETNCNNLCNVILYDLMGKQILQTNIENKINTVYLPELKTGIYLIQVIDEITGNKTTKKIIIE
jgi:hypothetical protein